MVVTVIFLIGCQSYLQKKQSTKGSKGGKKKKQVLKFTLDCTHPVEDGIMDAANFVSSFIPVPGCSENVYFLKKFHKHPYSNPLYFSHNLELCFSLSLAVAPLPLDLVKS